MGGSAFNPTPGFVVGRIDCGKIPSRWQMHIRQGRFEGGLIHGLDFTSPTINWRLDTGWWLRCFAGFLTAADNLDDRWQDRYEDDGQKDKAEILLNKWQLAKKETTKNE